MVVVPVPDDEYVRFFNCVLTDDHVTVGYVTSVESVAVPVMVTVDPLPSDTA